MKNDIYNTYNGKAYRFLSFEALEKTIVYRQLRFSRFATFNDPLDCSVFIGDINFEKYKKMGYKSFNE